MLCNVYDHEIFQNVIAWEGLIDVQHIDTSSGKLFISHLKPMPTPPYTAASVFRSIGELDDSYDEPLPPPSESRNGPELGADEGETIEVVYTKVAQSGKWYLAGMTNATLVQWPWAWSARQFPIDTDENRWAPFVRTYLKIALAG
jgi:hypothetical protein